MIHCPHQATVQMSDRFWKGCGTTTIFYAVLAASGSGNVLICLQFTFTVKIAVNLLSECSKLPPFDIFTMPSIYATLLLSYSQKSYKNLLISLASIFSVIYLQNCYAYSLQFILLTVRGKYPPSSYLLMSLNQITNKCINP